MTEQKRKITPNGLMLLGAVSYFASYLTRVNLSAVIEELSTQNILSKDILALAITCNMIIYGAGLAIAGVLTNKFQPKRLLFTSLVAAALMNLIIPFNHFLGSALSIYGVVLFSDAFGWMPTVSLWAGISVLGTLICIAVLAKEKTKFDPKF